MLQQTKRIWLDYLLLTVILGTLFLSYLGCRPLSSPDEGRYAEIPREMVGSQDYITPHLNGLKYFEKPPLVYWIEAIPLKLGLDSEFFLRLPIALFAIIGCLAVYAYANRIYSRTAGYFSAIVLATSVLYFSLSRVILLDLVLTVFMTVGLLSFLVGIKLYTGKERRTHLALASISFACAVLTKGLIGLVLPLGIIGLWLISLNRWHTLRPLYVPTNLLIFLAIVLPWHVLVSLKNPGFLDFYFIREHLERYLTPIHRRVQPFWFFIPIFTVGFFPWIIFLPRAIKNFISLKFKDWKIYDLEAFLLMWIGFIFLFFSFSSSKLIPYILPIFPPTAIIVGRFLSYITQAERSTKIEAVIYWIISILLAIFIPLYTKTQMDFDLYQSLSPYFFYIKFYLIGGSSLFLILSFFKKPEWKVWSLIAFHTGFLFVLNAASPLVQKTSMKSFARHIYENMPAQSEVIFYGMYAQDLPYYLGRTVKILNWSGELDTGKNLEPNNSIFLTNETFKKLWVAQKAICVITKKDRMLEIPFPSPYTPHVNYERDEYVLLCKK